VWQFFECNNKTNKSLCLVKVESYGNKKPCGMQLVGKNPTNLKVKLNDLNNKEKDLNIFLRRY